MNDIVQIKVWVPDLKALNEVMAAAKVQLECGSPKTDGTGNFIVTLYASKAEAAKIANLKYKHEVDEEFGATLKLRQAEVSRTDRFQDGKIKPTGLGIKK